MSITESPSLEFSPPAWGPLRLTDLARPFNRLVGNISKSALSVPSMMSVAERRFLFGLASKYYSGEGLIVDAGIFLGASTRAFGEGLRENPSLKSAIARWRKPVVSFERAIVTPTMPAFFKRNHIETDLSPGDSFADIVRKNVEPVSDVVDLRIGDIMETGRLEQPIEVLFLDVLKLPEINSFVVENYFSKLIPGRSVVIQQDYFYDLLPYIKTYQEAFSEYFSYIGEIGSTAVFLCAKQIPKEATLNLEDYFDAEEQIRLASVALQRSNDPARRFLMSLSKARLIRRLKGAKAAQAYLLFVKSEYAAVDVDGVRRLREALRSTEVACQAKVAASAEPGDY